MNTSAEKNGSVRSTADVNPTDSSGFDNYQSMDQELNECCYCCWIKTSNDSNSFKYEPSDLCCDHPMPIRGISLTPHQSTRIMVISSHGMTACQHHSDVVLQSHGTSLMRFETMCSLGCFVCSTSLTDGYIVTCRAFFRLYCWRVRSFRFYLTDEFDCCWVTAEGVSNCGEACGVGEIADWVTWFELGELDCCEAGEDGLALDLPSSLVISLFVIACISRLKSSIIA